MGEMHEPSDIQLLRDFAERHDETAFREIVKRYADLVYSAALRQVQSSSAAGDLAQGIFIDLARKAAGLARGGGPSSQRGLAGWLHRATRYAALNHLRDTRRRLTHERQAMEGLLNNSEPSADWEQISPALDEGLDSLSDQDREALLLRYFKNQDFRAVGLALGVSDDAAQKRVARAVERLREFFARRGVTVGAGGLAVVISTHAVHAAPAGLAVAISAEAVAGGVVSASIAATATKIITMTSLQKTLVIASVGVLAGAGIYEARQASQLREQNQALRRQLQDMAGQKLAVETPQAAAPAEHQGENVSAPVQTRSEAEWPARLLALNAGDWRLAYATGQQLATLPPDSGLAILAANWNSVTNVSARQQLLKAFDSTQHERLPAVLELGLLDASPEVQNWALNYLKEVALQDFSSNFAAGKDWLSSRRDSTLSQTFADAVYSAAWALRNSSGAQLRGQLHLLDNASQLLSKYPDVITVSGLNQVLAEIAAGGDAWAASGALDLASHIPIGDEWRRQIALPRMSSENPWEVRAAAARVLGRPGNEWAVQPLLDTLSEVVYSVDRPLVFGLAQPLAELGSPKAIPTMIALIQAENTYTTIYGIGYFGLSKMTGVAYDEKHDGAWWQQWWNDNKQRYPADVQALEIPRLAPVQRETTSQS
jgi:RNA polymerase sigma factor (sigma-70 family)